jgi:hypothetical protein
MRVIGMSLFCLATLGACVADSEGVADSEVVAETTQEVVRFGNNIFYDKFDFYQPGPIGGQGGWTGNCMVAPGVAPDKNLDCTGTPGLPNGQGAMHTFYRPPNRHYHFQFDVWTRNVVDGTHGKVFLENPPGDGTNTVIQFAIGCNNIRATFEYHANTSTTLLSFPCSNGPRYRVACNWVDGGTEFWCGAAVYPNDPVENIRVPALSEYGYPEAIGAFDRVRFLGGIGERQGTSTFDKVQVLSN